MTKTKILFDGNCIVCDFEISHYKKIAPEIFELIDISLPNFDPEPYALTKELVDKKMHVITPEGELKTGVDAFTHIWSRLKGYKILSVLIMLPLIYQLAQIGYYLFARFRKHLPKKNRS